MKLYCRCGATIARVDYDDHGGIAYTPLLRTEMGRTITGEATYDARTVHCPDHGYPDTVADQVAGVPAALADGKNTLHVSVSRTPHRG
jgi:hypothetical protein